MVKDCIINPTKKTLRMTHDALRITLPVKRQSSSFRTFTFITYFFGNHSCFYRCAMQAQALPEFLVLGTNCSVSSSSTLGILLHVCYLRALPFYHSRMAMWIILLLGCRPYFALVGVFGSIMALVIQSFILPSLMSSVNNVFRTLGPLG